jgi:hypothetical protein
MASTIEMNWRPLDESYLLRNHPWPSATTSGVVTSGGGEENKRRKREWWLSERSAKAIRAEVSTYASPFVTVNDAVDLLAGIAFSCLDHTGKAHPGFVVVGR